MPACAHSSELPGSSVLFYWSLSFACLHVNCVLCSMNFHVALALVSVWDTTRCICYSLACPSCPVQTCFLACLLRSVLLRLLLALCVLTALITSSDTVPAGAQHGVSCLFHPLCPPPLVTHAHYSAQCSLLLGCVTCVQCRCA